MRHGPIASVPADALCQTIKREVNHWGGIQGKYLAEHQATHDSDAQRAAKLRTSAGAQGEWHTTQDGGHGGHEDGTETQQTRLVDRLERLLAFPALGIEREV